MSSPSTTTKLTELEIVIPRDKFNDMGFIFRKLMETSLDVLDTIAKNSDKQLVDLAREFLPDLKNLTQPDIFLAKWGLTMSMLNSDSTTSNESDNTKETVGVEDDVVSTTSSVSSKKKKIKLSKKKIKLSKKTPVTSEEKPEEEKVVSKEQDTTEAKPVVKKLKKIKLSKPSSSSASVSSESATSTASSDKPKKKLKLRKPKKMKINSSD
jgi:outer membrane biosynthesis protein TonB